jgi:hypothetical protein
VNGDSLTLFEAISDMKSELLKDIGEIKSQNAAQLVHITSLRNELLGDGGRVTTLEKRMDDQEYWQNVKTIVVIPLLLTIHKVMTAIGWKI